MVRRPRCALLLVLVFLLGGCDVGGGREVSSTATDARGDAVEVAIDGDTLLLLEGGRQRPLVTLDPSEGELVHAAVRPGDRRGTTVLVLTRVEAEDVGPRYELRYLVDDPSGTTALYWFPWRLQVDDAVAEVVDTAPLPVWSPDGATIAWVEWSTDGTVLRTVEWRDDGVSSNPSDDVAAYRLEAVPAGAQLRAWEVGSDGVPVLRASDDATAWRIRLDVGRRAIALAEPA